MWWPSSGQLRGLDDKIIELIETEIKYEGYISKAMDQGCQDETHGKKKRIPANIDWDDIDSIATEARQKFKLINPETIGQASRTGSKIQQIFLF